MKKFLMFLFMVPVSLYAQNELQNASAGLKDILTNEISTVSKDTAYWSFPGIVGLNFAQTAFKNWAEGGQNSIATNALAQLNANYKKKKFLWKNNLSAEYGLFYSESNYFKWRKNSDKLSFTSNFGYQACKYWYYAALVDFKTQFNAGYEYLWKDNDSIRSLVSDFLSPAYLIGSVGLNYIPNQYVSVYVSPTTARMTIVNDTSLSSKYGLDAGKRTKSEFGAYAAVLNNFDVMKNVNLNSKLELFSAYETFGNVVVNWELLLTMKVNKYVNASVRTQVKYDDAIKSAHEEQGHIAEGGPKIQFKDVIAVGFSYNF